MARTQANDYKQKKTHIVDVATELFASKGFHATSIMDIAKACNTSKSSLYHYFDSKEQLLYVILYDHAVILRDSFLPINNDSNADASDKLEIFAQKLLFHNVSSRSKHKLILGELDSLGAQKKNEISILLREPIESIFDSLVNINPELEVYKFLQFPVAMMYIGMINWTHTWFSGEGELSTDVFGKLLCDTFINGFSNIDLRKHLIL
ncbi:MAG: TetR/AcrR family transcriptional regulator [Robiginitomaculum sp.]